VAGTAGLNTTSVVVALALGSALLFGAMTVALRFALRAETGAGAAATLLAALVVSATAAGIEAAGHGLDVPSLWPFALAGLIAPGSSQILFTLAVREAGPSRASVVVGAAPLVAVTIALLFLHEPLRLPLVLGAVLIVGGGLALATERTRPEHVRTIGLVYAIATTLFFATRDNLVRHLADATTVQPLAAAATTMLAGALVGLAYVRRLPTRRELRAFAPVGFCFGLSYVLLFEAYYRGRVSVVSPLVATESLWGVTLSAVFVRHDRIGRRVVLGALLIVSGGALIGAFR
jgi:drug/metabolite transporter (DMT)-like permease